MSGMSDVPNEVIVYRGLMYAMYRPRTLLPQVNLYITALGGDFWKYLNGEFAVNVTIKIHFSFIVWKITFSQEDALYSLLQRNISSLINGSDKTVKFKIQNLPTHLYSESVLHIWCLYCMSRP